MLEIIKQLWATFRGQRADFMAVSDAYRGLVEDLSERLDDIEHKLAACERHHVQDIETIDQLKDELHIAKRRLDNTLYQLDRTKKMVTALNDRIKILEQRNE